ncbi:MAG: putative branched-subunit amino acid permease [Candidatus Poriferisodalaceae bacterium]|jgi:predicted branched-subunit amino acid permease
MFETSSLRERVLPSATHFTTGEAITLAFAYFTVGLTVAVIHVTDGTSPLVMLGSILFVNAVTPTLAFAAVTASGGSTTAGVFSGWLVSTRFGLFAAAIAPRLWPSRAKRAVAAHVMFDPNVAMALRETEDEDARRVFTAAAFWLVVPWWVGGSLGILVGDRLTDPQALGLDAIFPAAMLAIVWPQLIQRRPMVLAALAAVIALALVEPAPGGVPVLVAASAALLAMRPTATPAPDTDSPDTDSAP